MIKTVFALIALGAIGFSEAALASTATTSKAPEMGVGSGTIVAQNGTDNNGVRDHRQGVGSSDNNGTHSWGSNGSNGARQGK